MRTQKNTCTTLNEPTVILRLPFLFAFQTRERGAKAQLGRDQQVDQGWERETHGRVGGAQDQDGKGEGRVKRVHGEGQQGDAGQSKSSKICAFWQPYFVKVQISMHSNVYTRPELYHFFYPNTNTQYFQRGLNNTQYQYQFFEEALTIPNCIYRSRYISSLTLRFTRMFFKDWR